MEGWVASCAPLSRRCGRGIWDYLYPPFLGEPRSGELVVVPFRELGLFPALVVAERQAPSPGKGRERIPRRLERVVARLELRSGLASLGRRLHLLFERLGLHPLEGAQVVGLGGGRPIIREFFFAPSPSGRWD